MTNEEKAREISQQWWSDCGWQLQATAFDAAIEAMAWKDKEWADRFQKAFEGLWTASFNIDTLSSKIETTVEFKHVTRE